MPAERWFNSTNAKDIGTLYLIFAHFPGLLNKVAKLQINSYLIQKKYPKLNK
jgi:heme/copper-type cytochrome/quinol oxidase subunit 1